MVEQILQKNSELEYIIIEMTKKKTNKKWAKIEHQRDLQDNNKWLSIIGVPEGEKKGDRQKVF